MRVGIITYGLDRSPAGIGRYTIDLLHALHALPNHPEIVLLSTEQQDHSDLWKQFEHHKLSGCQLLPALMTLGNIAVRAAEKKYKLDLVHDPNGIAPFLAKSEKSKYVVTIHDVFAFSCPDTHNRLDNWRYRYMLPQALRRTDKIITISDWSGQDIKRYLSVPDAKVRIIPRWVSEQFTPILDNTARQTVLSRYNIKQPYILYVGGINARKNIARLFEAYARVREAHPNVILLIAGKRQWQTGEIDATFQRLDLNDHVHFTGYVDDADLPALYSAAELFVFPSLYEGFGLPPLEAMACGTPVVTSNVSSLPEVVGDAALTVDPYDIPALAQAVDRVLSDGDLRVDLRRRGVERAAQFTWQRAARETLVVYEQVLGRATNDEIDGYRHARSEHDSGR